MKGLEGYQVAWANILGDWREEIVVFLPRELLIYTTTILALDRRPCLMQEPIYRIDVAHLSMGYGQVPMTNYCLDFGISKKIKPLLTYFLLCLVKKRSC